MAESNYFTWFKDDGKTELRKILYHLEGMGVTRIESKVANRSLNPKTESEMIKKSRAIAKNTKDKRLKKFFSKWKPSLKEHKWVLTKKGKRLVEKNETLKKLQEKGDKIDFFRALRDELDKKEFLIS